MGLYSFIKNTLSILDVIGQYVPLKPMGTYWKGSCIFHSETDASFTVSPEKQIFYCFGCQASGDIISFIAKLENLSQLQAAKLLIERYRLTPPQELLAPLAGTKNIDQTHTHHHVCEQVARWAHEQFRYFQSPQEYLVQRGITQESCLMFEIGYFPGGIKNIQRFIKEMATQNVLLKDLLATGIIGEHGSTLYSPFEERIIFPIKDAFGNYCGFGGRIFKQGDERAKYYNSKESDNFVKSKLLFGFSQAKKAMIQQKSVFLVEGYLDCVAMVQHGHPNVVATLGTACTLEHLKMLSRQIATMYLIYDGDKAGKKAVLRIAQLCWETNLDIKVIQLPDQHDPASFFASQQNLEPLITKAANIFLFFIQEIGNNFFQLPLNEKLQTADKVVSLISNLKDPFKQHLLLQQASQSLQIPLQVLTTYKNSHENKKKTSYPSTNTKEVLDDIKKEKSQKEITDLEERLFCAILAMVGAKHQELTKGIGDFVPFFSPFVQEIIKKITPQFVSQSLSVAHFFESFLETLTDQEKPWVIRVCMTYDSPISNELFEQLIMQFRKYRWKETIGNIKQEMEQAKLEGNQEKLQQLLHHFLSLKQYACKRGLV